jgi:hypothetical protein
VNVASRLPMTGPPAAPQPHNLEDQPMARFARLLAAAALTLAVVAPASAVATLAPLFTVAGVMNTGSFGTYFACTNTDTGPVIVGVEVFDQGGTSTNNPTTTAVSLGSQASVLFGTQGANSLSLDAQLSVGVINKGSAHILTTSKKVVCSALLVDPGSNPAVSMTTLTIAYKGKQKGD